MGAGVVCFGASLCRVRLRRGKLMRDGGHGQTASKRMVKEGVKGKIVFVASVLGYFSIVGYSTYSPGKFAVRGTFLACTRSYSCSYCTRRPS